VAFWPLRVARHGVTGAYSDDTGGAWTFRVRHFLRRHQMRVRCALRVARNVALFCHATSLTRVRHGSDGWALPQTRRLGSRACTDVAAWVSVRQTQSLISPCRGVISDRGW